VASVKFSRQLNAAEIFRADYFDGSRKVSMQQSPEWKARQHELTEAGKIRHAKKAVIQAVCTALGHARSFERKFSRFAVGE
jgi:hypothetical protein